MGRIDRLHVLGTGHAGVLNCYNTCFAMERDGSYFLVDTGGGNGILKQLRDASIPLERIHNIFISHEHTDHLVGLIWLIRTMRGITKRESYRGPLRIYAHPELTEKIRIICELLLKPKDGELFGDKIVLQPLKDGEKRMIDGMEVTFFDIHAKKTRQFGFSAKLEDGSFVFMGDEPFSAECRSYAQGAAWLCLEAFCRYEDRDIFKPYEKSHSTVKDAAETAASLEAKNLVIWHTEDSDLARRKENYISEAQKYFFGNVFVPDDLDVISL